MKADAHQLSWLENPEVFEVNRIPAHSDHLFYTTEEQARKMGEMPLKQSLNGNWKFHYADSHRLAVQDFYCLELDCSGWDNIQVPGHIQLQGHDACQYTNVTYPWDGYSEIRPPQISWEYNPVGSYVKYFTLDQELQNKRVYLSFQGVEAACFVWLNGVFVGYGEDSFTPSEFELTDLLQNGENKLAVQVFKRCSGSWLEDQDFWRFSGIFREVFLYAVPETHVNDLRVTTELSKDFSHGVLQVALKLQGTLPCQVEAVLLSPKGQEVARSNRTQCDNAAELSLSIQNPQLWSAEQPQLYTLLLILQNQQGQVVETVPQRFGFRRFEIEDGLMKLNGRRIEFRGVDRHEFNCRRGRAVTEEDMLWDIRLLKQNNINAVRTSHYPNQSEWYRLCDEYGIYLIDETNLETHGLYQWCDRTDTGWRVPEDREEWKLPQSNRQWLPAVLDRAQSMLERDKNHPSVLIWSCGNEAGGGKDFDEMARYFRKADPTRLVHYEGIAHDMSYPDSSDIESHMYLPPWNVEQRMQEKEGKPFILCEYMHAMGNSCGAMHKHMELMRRYPRYQGAFIWDYIDQVLETKGQDGSVRMAYGGDFGDRPTDHSFCANGIVYGDRKPSPKLQEIKYLYQEVRLTPDQDGVQVENRRLFTSTSDQELKLRMQHNGQVIWQATVCCEVPPLTTQHIPVQWPEWEQPGEYALQASLCLKKDAVWAPWGHETAFGEAVVQKPGPAVRPRKTAAFQVVHGDNHLGVHGKDFSVLFSCIDGGMVSLKIHGKEYLEQTPMPFYWRASTDNDRGNGHGFRCAPWLTATLYQKCRGFRLEEQTGQVTMEFFYELPGTAAEASVAYTVQSEGKIRVRARYSGAQGMPELPVFGLCFHIPAQYDRFRYYGLGPQENYIDRVHGARLGIFESTVKENLSHYVVPQECGNRTGVRWAEVYDRQGQGLRFEQEEAPFELGVLHYDAMELEAARHPDELPPVHDTVVRIMGRQMGVGGDDSWGARVHQEYLIPSDQPLEFSFMIDIDKRD